MNPAAVPADADELRRQAEKARIRERILREEAEHWVLEAEVRRELMEQLLRLAAPVLGRQAGGSDHAPVAPPPQPRMVAANSSSPVVPEVAQAQSKTNVPAAPSAKRKSPDQNVASTVSAATSSKKHKPSLSCTVCGIMLTGEKAMGDHFNGKGHRKKAAALAQPPPEPEQEEVAAEGDAMAMMPPTADYTPTKLTMLTNAGTMEEVTQMDGFLLCEVCNVRTADRVTMMCHLEGTKHITNAQKKRLAKNNGAKGQPMPASTTSAPGGDPADAVVLEVDGVPHTVRRVDGCLLCELCDVKAPAESGMRCHLSGKKHKSKAKAQAGTPATSAREGGATTVESSKAPGKNEVKVSAATAAVAEADGAGDSDSLTMEVDGVRHPLRRVDGFLVCVCCDVRAPAEVVMRSHLVGKKHKNKMAAAAAAGAGGKGAPVVVATGGQVQGNGSMTAKADGEKEIELSVAPQAKNTYGVAPMDVDEPAKVESIVIPTESSKDREITPEAKKDEHSAGEINGSVTPVKEPVKTTGDAIAATTGTPVKIQVEGKLFIVLRQENGRLSCERCGVHGCDKDGMLQHLYTKTHWEKVRLAEEAAACASATAAEEVNKKGEACGGEQVTEGTAAQVKN
ncbi:hypothetical protein ACP70R_015659 [Stipagrostis hirtigluma subsp. patula]